MAGARSLWCVPVVVALATQGALAAEPSAADRETSRSLYAQGMQALDAHDFAAAERSCAGAYKLVRAPTGAVCWARALEGLGKLVESRDLYLEGARFPVKADEPAIFATARETARIEADRLAKRVPSLTIIVSGAPESATLAVTFDGTSVAPETTRLPRKVNPGRHTVVVSAAGYAPTTVDVDVAEAEDRRVPVTLRADAGNAARASTTETPSSSPPTIAIVVSGIGAAGLVVGIVAGIIAGAKHGMLAGECGASNVCPPSAQNDVDAFHTTRTVSTVAYIVGAAGVIGGAILWFTMPSARASGPSARAWIGPTSAGVAGAF